MNTIELLGEEEIFRSLVQREITEFEDNKIEVIGDGAFSSCKKLTSVSFPNVTSIGNSAFDDCIALKNLSIPNATSIGNFVFSGCIALRSISLLEVTSTGQQAFFYCDALTSVSLPNVSSLGKDVFKECKSLKNISFPNVKYIDGGAFYSCKGLTEVSIPNATSIGTYAFRYCSNLTTIYVGTNTSKVCTLFNTNAFDGCTNLANIYVPASLVDSYKSATNWSSYADKIKADNKEPVECIALSITADDVKGNATSTTVYYTAECTYTKDGILQEGTMLIKGEVTSDSFEQNTSTTDTVQRTVSFTFLGKTATTTITQGVWDNRSISVTTEGTSSYGWVPADSRYNVDGYDVYMSNNRGVDKSQAVMKLECVGYKELTLYIRSYAESTCDYTIASNANASAYPTSYDSSYTKAHTRGNQKSGTTFSDYTAVTYTGLSDNDIIYIVFRKDGGGASGDDRGYVLIPKA